MQKLCCVRTRQQFSASLDYFVTSLLTHISINSQPFLVGIVSDNIRVCLENLDNYLQRKRGISGVSLAAYTREDVDLPPDGEDPGFGTPSILKEMIRHAPHTGATYHADNKAVLDTVQHVAHEGPAWGWVQSFAQQRNGRGAYLALKQHYLGGTFQARLHSRADQIIGTAYYDGTK